MATLQEILARAQALREETALGSISPERAGSIMYDTLQQINQMQLEGGSLVISKIYESVAAMQADTAPVSDLTGQDLRQGQLVVIVPSDTSSSDLGSVYRYNGTTEGASSWSFTGKIGGYPMDQTPTQGSTRAVTSGGVYEQITQLGQDVGIQALTQMVDAGTIEFVVGSFSGGGAESANNKRIRCTAAISTKIGWIGVPDGFLIHEVYYYSSWNSNSDYVFVGPYKDIGKRYYLFDVTQPLARFSIRKADNSVITPDDYLAAISLVSPKIGTLANLKTTNKSNLVAAVNELGQDVNNAVIGITGLPQLEAPTVSNNQYPARRDGSRSAHGTIHGYTVDLTLYPGYSEVTFRGICAAGSQTNKVVAGIFIDSNGTVLSEVTGNVAMNDWTSEIPSGAVTLWASYLFSAGMPQTVTFSAVSGALDAKADKSTVDELEVEVDGKADKELAYVGVPVTELMSRFYLNRVTATSGYYVVGTKPLENGKTYRIVFSAIRDYQYNLHLVIVNTPTPAKSSTDIVTYLASFNQSNSPFSGTFEYTPNQDGLYVCVWTQSGGAFEIVNLSVSELEAVADEVEDNLVGFRNYDLFLASKKRYLTSAQQTAIGLTPNVKYNDITSLFQFVHVSDLHQDMNRFARAVKFCKENGLLLVNTGDTVKQSGSEGIPSFISVLEMFDGPYIHCIGNHDSWGHTLEETVYNKFIAPFYEKYGWTLPSGVSNPTYFTIDDTVSMIRFIVLNQWEKYGVSTGGTHISQTQADFLVSSLQSVPAGYAVIVVEHTPNNALTRDANYPKFFQEAYSGTIGEASTKMISDIVDAWISGTSISGTYNINGSITINADFSQSASHEFIAFLNGHTHEDAITYLPNTTNRMLVLNLTTSNCYIAPSGEGTLSENGDLYRDDKSEMQDAFNVYTIDRDLKVVKVVRIGSDVPFDLGEKRDCMVIPYV